MIKNYIALLLVLLVCFVTISCNKTTLPTTIIITSPPPGTVAKIEIKDAYCLDNHSSTFLFRFTLVNLTNDEMTVTSTWTLNDPKANGAGPHIDNTHGRYYEGQDVSTLRASGEKALEFRIKKTRDYDPTFYVMYIGVYQNGTQLAFYSDQKSSRSYDYGTLPPVLKTQ